ncbi:hypothetical protein Y032_0008g174 [Ancylostoma ceylanicum]|nr:hypothetical protein Y032_0008g174 [Ancylostoma ceylanicum]
MKRQAHCLASLLSVLVIGFHDAHAGKSNPCDGYKKCTRTETCISDYGKPRCVPLNLNCTQDEVIDECGDLCEPTCADATGTSIIGNCHHIAPSLDKNGRTKGSTAGCDAI